MNHGTALPATGLTQTERDVITFFGDVVPELQDQPAGTAHRAAPDLLNGMSLERAGQIFARLIDSNRAAYQAEPLTMYRWLGIVDHPAMPRAPRRRLADHAPAAVAGAA